MGSTWEHAAEKAAAERRYAEKAAAKKDSEEVATTSFHGKDEQVNQEQAEKAVKPTQSAVAGSKSPPSKVEVSEKVEKSEVAVVCLPPLPLCHYCCHLGSGDNPVHYFLQCLCEEKVCNCQCYCSEEQLVHKKKFFPGGFSGSLVPVSPGDRPRAKSVGEARANKLDFRGVPMASRPCDNENCL